MALISMLIFTSTLFLRIIKCLSELYTAVTQCVYAFEKTDISNKLQNSNSRTKDYICSFSKRFKSGNLVVSRFHADRVRVCSCCFSCCYWIPITTDATIVAVVSVSSVVAVTIAVVSFWNCCCCCHYRCCCYFWCCCCNCCCW